MVPFFFWGAHFRLSLDEGARSIRVAEGLRRKIKKDHFSNIPNLSLRRVFSLLGDSKYSFLPKKPSKPIHLPTPASPSIKIFGRIIMRHLLQVMWTNSNLNSEKFQSGSFERWKNFLPVVNSIEVLYGTNAKIVKLF